MPSQEDTEREIMRQCIVNRSDRVHFEMWHRDTTGPGLKGVRSSTQPCHSWPRGWPRSVCLSIGSA